MYENKYHLASFLAGFFAKMYDDIADNEKLNKFNTEFNLELLKGFHFILFTVVSIKEPIFLIIQLIVNYLNYIAAPENIKNYELSLYFSFTFLLYFIDYSNITFQNIKNGIISWYRYVLGLFLEPLFSKEEFGYKKLMTRTLLVLYCIYTITFTSVYDYDKYISLYILGYALCSVIVQIYCIYFDKEQQKIEEEIKVEKEEIKEIKEEIKVEKEEIKVENI
jgi:hypothetical protein